MESYILHIYDTRIGKHRRLKFNSVEASSRYMKEYLNHKEVKIYIARLRGGKMLDQHEFGRNNRCLQTYYGDIDLPFPSVAIIKDEIETEGKFEYRLGTSDPMFYDGFGCIYFKLENEYKLQTSKHIFLTTRGTIQSNSS